MIQRSDVVPDLVDFFMEEYKAAMRHYETQDQIEFTRYLLRICILHIVGKEKEMAESINKDLELLKKQYGKKFKAFEKARLEVYFQPDRVLIEKDLYQEFKELGIKRLTEEEQKAFVKKIHVFLNRYSDDLKKILKTSQAMEQNGIRANRKSKIKTIKRRPSDTMTSLNKQQTVLLIQYLQKEEVLLKDEFLHNTRAGAAFEILTGYNRNTISLYLNPEKSKHCKNKKNLKQLQQLFVRLKAEIDKELNQLKTK